MYKAEVELTKEDFEGHRDEIKDKMKVAEMLLLGYKKTVEWLDEEILKA